MSVLDIALREYGVVEYQGTGGSNHHVVNKGDTLYNISNRYDISVKELQRLNSLTSTNIILGQHLKVSDDGVFDGKHNPRILQYAREAGFTNVIDDETSWCSIFWNWVMLKSQHYHSGKANARSWLDLVEQGRAAIVHNIRDANTVVFWRESPESWKGHVGGPLSYSDDKDYIYTLGGNQSNMVCVKPYPVYRILALLKVYSIR